MKPVVFHGDAEAELDDAMAYYCKQGRVQQSTEGGEHHVDLGKNSAAIT